MKEFFKKFNLFDILYLSISCLVILVVSIICKSNALTIIYTILNILSLCLMAKGFYFAPIPVLVTQVMYAVISYQGKLYGETILYVALLIPIQIVTCFKFFIQRKKEGRDFSVTTIKLKEWIVIAIVALAMCVGVYFLLKALNTNYLLLSVPLFVVSVIATYLVFRRSEYNYIFYLVNGAIYMTVWLLPFIQGNPGGMEVLPIGIATVAYAINNVRGFINWRKIKKEQNTAENQELEKKTQENIGE